MHLNITYLPQECLVNIFANLDEEQLTSALSPVCQLFRKIAADDVLWQKFERGFKTTGEILNSNALKSKRVSCVRKYCSLYFCQSGVLQFIQKTLVLEQQIQIMRQNVFVFKQQIDMAITLLDIRVLELCHDAVLRQAIRLPQEATEVTKMVLEAGAKPTEDHLLVAINQPEPEVVRLLLATGLKLTRKHFDAAANPQHTKVLQALQEMADQLTADELIEIQREIALPSQQPTKLVELFKKNGVEPTRKLLQMALPYLCHYCPYQDDLTSDLIKLYTDKKLKPLKQQIRESLPKQASLEIMETLFENNLVETLKDGLDHNTNLLRYSNLEILEFVIKNGFKVTSNYMSFAFTQYPALEVVRLLLENIQVISSEQKQTILHNCLHYALEAFDKFSWLTITERRELIIANDMTRNALDLDWMSTTIKIVELIIEKGAMRSAIDLQNMLVIVRTAIIGRNPMNILSMQLLLKKALELKITINFQSLQLISEEIGIEEDELLNEIRNYQLTLAAP